MGWDQAGGEIENGSEKGAERHEGGHKLGRTQKFGDPREGPVVPVKAGEGQQQSVGDEGDEGN